MHTFDFYVMVSNKLATLKVFNTPEGPAGLTLTGHFSSFKLPFGLVSCPFTVIFICVKEPYEVRTLPKKNLLRKYDVQFCLCDTPMLISHVVQTDSAQ